MSRSSQHAIKCVTRNCEAREFKKSSTSFRVICQTKVHFNIVKYERRLSPHSTIILHIPLRPLFGYGINIVCSYIQCMHDSSLLSPHFPLRLMNAHEGDLKQHLGQDSKVSCNSMSWIYAGLDLWLWICVLLNSLSKYNYVVNMVFDRHSGYV